MVTNDYFIDIEAVMDYYYWRGTFLKIILQLLYRKVAHISHWDNLPLYVEYLTQMNTTHHFQFKP